MPLLLLLLLLSCEVAPEVDTAACTNHFTVVFVDESGAQVPVFGPVDVDVDGETHGAACMLVGRELDCNVGRALSDNEVTVDLMGYEPVTFVLYAACDGEDVDAGTQVFSLRDCPERDPVPAAIVDFVDLAGRVRPRLPLLSGQAPSSSGAGSAF